ncbi:triphosphoribosyl-dephospho-CoA synthase CitG [Desulfovibrio sp. OttesenSCG-928-O18]|nr:triphosphoribosyl-dephospho-CoA synthase CitG [Desulfovibrio sp. OttesenSCG-928-O18]
MTGFDAESIATLAHTAVLMEAGASPKPGLVCPDHNGAHKDMDYPLFVVSADSLRPYFEECAAIGLARCRETAKTVFPLLREAGVRAEKAMFAATKGVNTHKGMIFSMGLMAAGAGRVAARGETLSPEAVAREAASFVQGIVAKDLEPLKTQLPERRLTAGEKLYLEHGIPGIRQEAEDGYPSALGAFSLLRQSLESVPLERALPNALLFLMATTDDTNIIWRGGMPGLAYARNAAKEALDAGGMATEAGERLVYAMRDEFVRRNISPGGSADLLALAAFFLLLWRRAEEE